MGSARVRCTPTHGEFKENQSDQDRLSQLQLVLFTSFHTLVCRTVACWAFGPIYWSCNDKHAYTRIVKQRPGQWFCCAQFHFKFHNPTREWPTPLHLMMRWCSMRGTPPLCGQAQGLGTHILLWICQPGAPPPFPFALRYSCTSIAFQKHGNIPLPTTVFLWFRTQDDTGARPLSWDGQAA